MTDGHSLIYHSSTIPMAVISKGDFVRRGFCPSYEGDFVHLVKIMRGIMPRPFPIFIVIRLLDPHC